MGATWLGLATVLASAVPSSLAAYWGYRSQKEANRVSNQLVTGNEKTVGEMVTEVHGKESQQSTDFDTHK